MWSEPVTLRGAGISSRASPWLKRVQFLAQTDQWHWIRRSPAPYIAIGIHFVRSPAVTAGLLETFARGD